MTEAKREGTTWPEAVARSVFWISFTVGLVSIVYILYTRQWPPWFSK